MKRTEEQRLDHIVRRIQTDLSEDAPADAVSYAKNLFRSRVAVPKLSALRKILAVLNIDLAPNIAALGERSASEGQARQILFEAGECAVDLRVRAIGNSFYIRGQILGDGYENGTVEINNEHERLEATIDDISEFELSEIPAGTYTMTVKGDENEIEIENIVLA